MNQFDDGKAVRITDLAVLRATETWQQAGAYYVRIQAMAKKHHIPLRQEFDEHDTPETKYSRLPQRECIRWMNRA